MTTRYAMRALVAVGLAACSVVAVILLSSCGGKEPAVDPLAGTEWQVQSYSNPQVAGLTSPLAGTQLTASWANGQVSGTAGCNSYSAAYTVDGDSLSTQTPVTTKMSCAEPPGIMEQETAFLAALASAGGFTHTGAQLQIFDSARQVVVIFVPYAPAPEPTQTPAQPTATPAEATQPPAEATPTPAAVANSWERIQAAGRIVAGTASGYPPFEYYVGPDLDGFDIALMDEIGRRLGLRVDYKDLDAEGLMQGLDDGEIDVAIAHIVWTEEREEHADFSQVYYVDRPAALALQSSNIKLTTLEDLTKYRVGVQNNSVYETRMKTLFEQAGLLPVDYLSGYVDAEHEVEGLKNGQVDVALMHNQAALAFVEQGGVKEVGVAAMPIYLAIAIPQGQATLKAELDDTIKTLDEDGTIAELAKRYMGDNQLEPTPTPAPTTAPKPTSTPTAGPAPECSNRMEKVKDPAVSNVKPGKAFTKTWQVKNAGTCTWGNSYQLVFLSGEKMNGNPVPVTGGVKAGATYEFRLDLVAPVDAGVHTGIWQMTDPKGTLFGEKLNVSITVPAPPTSTPTPTPTPLTPYVKFWADKYQIKPGETTIIRWQAEQVNAYWVYRQDQRWQDHPEEGDKGEREVQPAQTTIWYLRVEYRNGQVETLPCEIRVDQPPPQAPKIERFTIDLPAGDPPGQIWLGETVKIRWEIGGGQSDEVRLTANGVLLDTRTDGSLDHMPEQVGPVEYTLWARGPAGEDSQTQTISVVTPVLPITPEPPPDDPEIYSFGVSPSQIQAGECVDISWSVGGGTTYIGILRDGTVIMEPTNLQGQQQECLDQPGSYTYELRAANAAGKEVLSEPQSVNVTEAPPPEPPLAGTRWLVIAMNDGAGNPVPLLEDVPLTASFGHGGALDGSAGCNTYSATYVAEGNALTIRRLTTSGNTCSEPPGIMEQEAAFLEVLPAAANFVLEGSQLTILGPTGQVLLVLSLLLM